jgi:hypothetical protein
MRLEAALEALGVPKADAARAVGATPSKLGNWTAHQRETIHYPDPYLVSLLCDRYGITMDWIYRGKVAGLPNPLADRLLHWRPEDAGKGPAGG